MLITKASCIDVQVDAILVINAINWGRFDQMMGVLQSLFLTHAAAPPTHLLSADSFITLLSSVSVHTCMAARSINRNLYLTNHPNEVIL